MLCGICENYFKTLVGDIRGRICMRKPLDKRGQSKPIKFNSQSCERFRLSKSLYCQRDEMFMSIKTCLKRRRIGECSVGCDLGQAVLEAKRSRRK